jgi:multidrug resistance efflux pump
MNPASSGTNELASRLRSADFAPILRSEVAFAPTAGGTLIRLSYDGGSRWVDLSPLDCLIAQQMDGSRSVLWLTQFARQYDQAIEVQKIEQLILDLHARDLVFEKALPAAVQKEGKVVPLPTRRPVDEYEELRDDLFDAFDEDPEDPTVAGGFGAHRPRAGFGGPEQGMEQARHAAAEPEAEPAEPQPEPEAEPAPQEAQPETPEGVEAEQQALWQEMRKVKWHQRRWVRVLLVLGVLVLAAAIVPYPLKITSETVIVPLERAYVRAKTAGIIAEITVDEAAVVRKGDVLARLDDRELKTEQRKAAADIQRIEAEIVRLRRGARNEEIEGQRAVVAAAANEVAFARKEATRRARMAQQGVGSVQARDQAEHEFQVKQKALAEAGAALRLLKAGSRPEEIAGREAELDRAKAQLAFVDQQLELTVIRAPIDGVLLTPKFRERLYEKIEAGGLLCQIAKTDRMRAEIYLSENDMDSVEVGQPVVVKVQSYPTREFTGKVDFLAPTVERKGDENRVRVVSELANTDGLLKQDMTGYGEINCGNRRVLALLTRRVLRWVRVRFLL